MHPDDETLAMAAMGEYELDDKERDHVALCPRCTAETDAVRRLVVAGRAASTEELVTPAPSVWQAIHAELGLSAAVAGDPLPPAQPTDHQNPMTTEGTTPEPAATEPERTASGQVTPIHGGGSGSGFRRWWPLAVAALFVGIVAGVGGTLLWPTTPEKVVAEATLEPFPNWTASGSAQVAEADGVRELIVDLVAPAGGLREVWLIDPQTSGLVSLGLLDGASGQFRVPTEIDLTRYSVVDISEEPDDGNPGHSGDSIVRGELRNA